MPGVYICTMDDDSRVRVGQGGHERAEDVRRKFHFDDVEVVFLTESIRLAYLKEDRVWQVLYDVGLPVQKRPPRYTWFYPWDELTEEEAVEVVRRHYEKQHSPEVQVRRGMSIRQAWVDLSEEDRQVRLQIMRSIQSPARREHQRVVHSTPEALERHRKASRIAWQQLSEEQKQRHRQSTSKGRRAKDMKLSEEARKMIAETTKQLWQGLSEEQRAERGRRISEGKRKTREKLENRSDE